jgi:hypothetical protein
MATPAMHWSEVSTAPLLAKQVDSVYLPVLNLSQRGFRMFPVETRGKRPLISEWPQRATSDADELRAWVQQYPGCNWGLVCGLPSGVFVLDVDGEDGAAAIRSLCQRYGDDWTNTLRVETGRGVHLYFDYPSDKTIRNSASRIAEGLDIRGEGGYVIVPPSTHPSGTSYSWGELGEHDPVTSAPDWLLQMLSAVRADTCTTTTAPTGPIPQGKRNEVLTSLAGTMRRRAMSATAKGRRR